MSYQTEKRKIKIYRNVNITCLIFLAILIFMLVFFPLSGGNWRFEIGVIFSQIYHSVGTMLLYFGIIFILLGIMSLCSKNIYQGFLMIIIGVLLFSISGFLLNPGTFGASNTGREVPKGYH
jgi:hypothetical protein